MGSIILSLSQSGMWGRGGQLYPIVTSSFRHLAKGTVKPLKFKEKILNAGIFYI